MEQNFILFFFLLGLFVGSFLNSIIYRMEKGESVLKGRSYCPHCRHQLAWQDLIPLFSFLILRGRCRYCREKISWQYPLVELSTGLLFALVSMYWLSGFNWLSLMEVLELFYLLTISCFLLIIFVFDLKHYIIPDRIIYPAIVVSLLYLAFVFLSSGFRLESGFLLSAIGAAGFFLAIVLVSQGRWMGVGDIKLAFLMGLVLGWPHILTALFLAFFLGAIIGTGLIFLKRKTLKSEVPFGPFLVVGLFLALFWSQKLIDWYFTFFL